MHQNIPFRYYVCIDGVSVSKTCGDGQYWDKTNNSCTENISVCYDGNVGQRRKRQFPTPNLSPCSLKQDLFNPINGAYIKSACTIQQNLNYDASEQLCRSNNMQLFVIDNINTQRALMQLVSANLSPLDKNGWIRINGRGYYNDVIWNTYNPNKAPLFNGVDWYETECLLLQGRNGVFKPTRSDCGKLSWCICEYRR